MTRTRRDITDRPSLGRAVLTGSLGFGAASLCVFATVAFAERWMYTHLGVFGAYLAWCLLFILLGGLALSRLAAGSRRGVRFYIIFSAAFFMYSLGWVSAYFILPNRAGEWAGSLAGSVLMALVIAAGFGSLRRMLSLSAVLFVANSVGYFLGAGLFDSISGSAGMVLWGCVYGLSLGAGLGAVFYMAQTGADG